MDESFLVLIGSYARGDANDRSDCDVLAVNMAEDRIPSLIPGVPIDAVVNVVTLSRETFERLYKNGSLFLFHAFKEGVLISGGARHWNDLKGDFRVQQDFRAEIDKIHSVSARFLNPDKFGGRYLSPMVNAFPLIKNAAIFFLAHKGVYEFSKVRCLRRAIEDNFVFMEISQLIDFYDYAIKELAIELPFHPDDKVKSERILRAVAMQVGAMRNEIA